VKKTGNYNLNEKEENQSRNRRCRWESRRKKKRLETAENAQQRNSIKTQRPGLSPPRINKTNMRKRRTKKAKPSP